ncbi:phytanoyl- dioxygenase [Colletotrichum karsti]|uniref:Phytanoyl- dioxygenase n=1 Tax=Colletotrichum karsti TaxID=1095194 RepID=A0A9P6I5E4_9PEZI|nr:phytanoyl- dioxygenase [Colletotrichum karsti]KAF9877613.1 phytanoyl- dioxygenase [Colletotrichum karsti]
MSLIRPQQYVPRSQSQVAVPAQFHNKSAEDEAEAGRAPTSALGTFPSPKTPRTALLNPSVARYFHHYITDIAPWYDLSDASLSFGTKLPEIALDSPLPFAAILALSAVHVSQTTAPSAKAAAEFYHGHCIRLLIELKDDDEDEANTGGLALASVCLLRSYEILSEEIDPNRHLRGAYSLAAYRSPLVDYLGSGMRTAGFWNYLREDITFSLFQRCPLKIDLDRMPLPTQHDTDQSYLNTVSLILGRIINACFSGFVTAETWVLLFDMLRDWSSGLPACFKPFSREERGLSLVFSSTWMLTDCHAAAIHYKLVCVAVLCTHATPVRTIDLVSFLSLSEEISATMEDILERCASDICGIAFTTNIPSVLVNSFGPIAYCARFIREKAAQQELIRRLMASKMKTFARPITSLLHQRSAFRGSVGQKTLASLTRLPTHPAIIRPSAAEVRDNFLAPRNLELAVRHLYSDGLVVVEDVVPHEDLDALNEKMVKDARYLQSLGDKGPFNYNLGNLQQDPPPVAEFFHKSIFTNPIATQITSTVLGPRPKWTFCSANSAMPPLPGSSPQRQPVHSDADFAHPSHPFALVINVPLVSMTPENGSTELWLGTHTADVSAQEGKHGERASGRIKEELLAQRRDVRGPSQPGVKKGSIVVRDLRLWHAGMPNMSEEVRVMLAMIHFAPWYRNPMRLQFGEDVRPLLAGLEKHLEIPVDWIEQQEALGSYLGRGFGNSYDFDQEK